MLRGSSALSEFRTSLSEVLTLWHCVKVKQRYHCNWGGHSAFSGEFSRPIWILVLTLVRTCRVPILKPLSSRAFLEIYKVQRTFQERKNGKRVSSCCVFLKLPHNM